MKMTAKTTRKMIKNNNNENEFQIKSNTEEELLLELDKLYQFNNCDSVINFLLLQLCLQFGLF